MKLRLLRLTSRPFRQERWGWVRCDEVVYGRSGEVGYVLVVARCVKAGEVR